MIKLITAAILLLIVLSSGLSGAAPIPQVGPMLIEGVIDRISWNADRFVKGSGMYNNGKWHPMSGSLGHDRTIPAHYRILLKKTRVESHETAVASRSFKSGSDITLVINHPANDGFLMKGMRIKVYDYTVRGDEGGDWYSFSRITVSGR
ncbi:MAG: hypothetical protein HGB36_10290 [Chlorobiaceae bacterium]|jgi:hypothetical protein|nr:hypothetical protein [Chlorobiaceae bacterium]